MHASACWAVAYRRAMVSRRSALTALGLALILCIGAAPAAAAKPVVCKKGFGKLVLQGKAQCVAVAKLVPKGAAAPSEYVYWVRFALDRQLGKALEPRFVKPRFRGKLGVKAKPVLASIRARSIALATKLDSTVHIENLRATRSPLAVTTTTSPVTTTTSANGASVSGSISSTDSATGTTATLDLTGRVQRDPATGQETSSELELGLGVKSANGKSFRIAFTIPMNSKNELIETCPSADGVVRRKGSLKFQRSTRETKTMVGLDYINETINVNATTSFTGKVDADANLSSIAYDVKVNMEHAFAGSALFGLVRNNSLTHFVVASSGTLNPATGAVATGNVSISGDHRGTGLSRAEAAAEFAKAIAAPDVRAKLEELVATFIKSHYEGLKEAEKHWQTPNACAKLELSPTTATLAEDETTSVKGLVRSSKGEQADGKWTAKTVARGSVTTLPGTSTKTSSIDLTMRGASADAANHAVDVTLRATSPAGVAEGPWVADAAANTLYYRVIAASGTQTAGGTLVSSIGLGCTFNVPSLGPWSYTFALTSGPPDGTIEIEPEFNFLGGSVRASGVSVAPAIEQTITCPGGGDFKTRDAITYTGRFGPAVSFSHIPGNPSTVQVFWSVLSPPPLLDVEMEGPDCRPVGSTAGTPFETTVPLATLRQRTPFTLSTTAPWTVDKTDILGHTTCTGTTTQSLTLQRVNADGSPLG
jgi:hypothetical protein